jgi:hypothetical protein
MGKQSFFGQKLSCHFLATNSHFKVGTTIYGDRGNPEGEFFYFCVLEFWLLFSRFVVDSSTGYSTQAGLKMVCFFN